MSNMQMHTLILKRDIDSISTYINNNFDVNKHFKEVPFVFHICNFAKTLDILKLFVHSGAKLNIIYNNKNIIDYIIKSPKIGLYNVEYNMIEYIFDYYVSHNYDFELNITHVLSIIQNNRIDIFNLFNRLIEFNNLIKNNKYLLFLENLKHDNNILFLTILFDNNLLHYRNNENETLLHICLNEKKYDYAQYLIE
jgi:hypothetical protein